MEFRSEKVVAADYYAAVEECFRRNWTDGLAVVPPSPERVEEMVRYVGRDPQQELGEVPPRYGIATVEKVAISCVMAGCLPEYMPVVIAAMEAMLDPHHNLAGVQTTTHGCVPLTIVNGPIRGELKVNCGDGVFGSGYRANGTIGRAIRLILWNLGGNYPWEVDKSTHAHPGKWSYCIGENEEGSPWEPLHVERGISREASAVTVFSCDGPQGIIAGGSAEQVLGLVCDNMASLGPNNYYFMGETLVVFSPLNAQQLAQEGWSKRDVKHCIWEKARTTLGKVKRYSVSYERALIAWPKWVGRDDEEERVPLVPTPQDIHIMVAGGMGRFISVCPGWGDMGGYAITREIRPPTRRS